MSKTPPTTSELVEALSPLLNEKALAEVKEMAEAASAMRGGRFGTALRMLLMNHDKRAAMLKRLKDAERP